MKQFLVIFIFSISLTSFPNTLEPSNKKRIRVSKIFITELTTDLRKEERTYNLFYGNEYIEKIVIDKINTYGIEGKGLIKQFNRDEVIFEYNDKKQLVKETYYMYVGSDKKQGKTISYIYDEQGYIISKTLTKGKIKMTNTYEYNEKCLLTKSIRSMKEINHEIFWNYVYDDNNNLVELDLKTGNYFSNSTSFFTDNKKSPLKTMYPEKYCLIYPEVYGKSNPTEVEEVSSKYTKKHKTKYTYNSKKYPKKSVEEYFENNKLQKTTTTTYSYEKI